MNKANQLAFEASALLMKHAHGEGLISTPYLLGVLFGFK